MRRSQSRALAIFLGAVLSACGGAADSSPSVAAPASSGTASPTASPSPMATLEPQATPSSSVAPVGALAVNDLARITVGGLTLRAEPSTAAEPIGTLPVEAAAFVVAGPVEADGYTWYRLASPRIPSVEWCAGETPAFHCWPWIGWAAGMTPTGDRWIERLEPDCALGRDTTSYLSMDTLTRFACAGRDEWRLVTYLAPSGGRGCFPAWVVNPYWMDQSCSLFFPQPVKSDFDGDTRIQGFIPPELGGFSGFDELKGSWVEVVGHLDDPAAQTCTTDRNELITPEDPTTLPSQPDPVLTVFTCRLNFVVTEVTATAPPSS